MALHNAGRGEVERLPPGSCPLWAVPVNQWSATGDARAARLCGRVLEADGPLVVFLPLLAGVVRDHPDLSSAGVFRLAWRCGR